MNIVNVGLTCLKISRGHDIELKYLKFTRYHSQFHHLKLSMNALPPMLYRIRQSSPPAVEEKRVKRNKSQLNQFQVPNSARPVKVIHIQGEM